MKKILYLSIITIAIALLASAIFFKFNHMEKKSVVKINGHVFQADVVSTTEQREKGLRGRDGLPTDGAMLFVFPQAGIYAFWMKDMRFDLDIIWIENGKIAYIARNVPYSSLEVIHPPVLADKVLEINAGLSDKYGFQVGDIIEIMPD